MPPEFGTTLLTELLRNYFNRLGTTTSVRFHFLSSGEDNYFDKQETIMVYRILLELTNNILKHSEADEATVQLVYYDKYLEIMVEDNGKGFSGNIKKGMGIKNIESRVKFLEGKITIDSGGKGTTVMIQVPYKILYL
jgi:signal transduction histidine kinase